MSDWATAIFPFEHSTENSRFVRRIWRTRSVVAPRFLSVAVPYWEIVFVTNANGIRNVWVRGPETTASVAEIPAGAEFFGIQFELGAYMPSIPVSAIVDGSTSLPVTSAREFCFAGSAWELPTFENAAVFAKHLVGSGALDMDQTVADVLQRLPVQISDRTIQRRFLRTTGLSYATIRQIEKATQAAELLRSGLSILDVVDRQTYSDQAHLTRSLKRFLGQTPGTIVAGKQKT